jgi:hypothetical protein
VSDRRPSGYRVEVVRSARRVRTVQARLDGDVVRVRVPAAMPAADEARWVEELVGRIERRARPGAVDLADRAAALAGRHGLPLPSSIRWVDNQGARWGSCTPATGEVRISSRLAGLPGWVLDYVIVHELAHLVVPDHSAAFRRLVARYPRAERAKGYLQAVADGAAGRGSG